MPLPLPSHSRWLVRQAFPRQQPPISAPALGLVRLKPPPSLNIHEIALLTSLGFLHRKLLVYVLLRLYITGAAVPSAPFSNRNHELGDGHRTVPKLRIQRDRRVGQMRTPGGFVCQWKVEH